MRRGFTQEATPENLLPCENVADTNHGKAEREQEGEVMEPAGFPPLAQPHALSASPTG